MIPPRLIPSDWDPTPYLIRHWMAEEVALAARHLRSGRFSAAEAAVWLRGWATIKAIAGRCDPDAAMEAAAAMLDELLSAEAAAERAVLNRMVDAAARHLSGAASDRAGAATAAADIARAAGVPPHLIDRAMRFAQPHQQRRRRAHG